MQTGDALQVFSFKVSTAHNGQMSHPDKSVAFTPLQNHAGPFIHWQLEQDNNPITGAQMNKFGFVWVSWKKIKTLKLGIECPVLLFLFKVNPFLRQTSSDAGTINMLTTPKTRLDMMYKEVGDRMQLHATGLERHNTKEDPESGSGGSIHECLSWDKMRWCKKRQVRFGWSVCSCVSEREVELQ